jgi:hypothetical protein
VSVTAALAELVTALGAAGLRVAVRDGDITPPVVYIRIGTASDAGGPLTGSPMTVFYVHYIPIRGVENLAGDADALDTIFAALTPLTWTELTATNTSVTVKNDSWPCYRLDAALPGVTAAAAALPKG